MVVMLVVRVGVEVGECDGCGRDGSGGTGWWWWWKRWERGLIWY